MAEASEANLALRRNFREKEYALSRARSKEMEARISVKAAQATLDKLSQNGADASVRDKAAEDLKQAIAAREAAEAAIPQAKAEWISSQAAFNASNLGKRVKAVKQTSLAGYSQFTTRRAREQETYIKGGSPSQAPAASQGGRRSKSRSRRRKRRTVKRNRTKYRR